mgnify:CR=1 FL=1
MPQKTILNDTHRRLGARMVDFGGWDMPLHYGSQLEEHHAVRRDSGMFDVSHMCAVDVVGPDSKAFLSRLIANNVDKLKLPGKALYSAMLNEAGGVVDDLIVYFLSDTEYRVVVNAGTADKDGSDVEQVGRPAVAHHTERGDAEAEHQHRAEGDQHAESVVGRRDPHGSTVGSRTVGRRGGDGEILCRPVLISRPAARHPPGGSTATWGGSAPRRRIRRRPCRRRTP